MAQATGIKFARHFAAQDKIVGFEVAVTKEARNRLTISEEGLSRPKLRFKRTAFKIRFSITNPSKETPAVVYIVLHFQLMAQRVYVDGNVFSGEEVNR